MRVLILSRYARLGASSRLRFYQYLPYLESHGFDITVVPLLGEDYITGLYRGSVPVFSIVAAYVSRLGYMLRSKRYDLVWVEKEMLPWVPSWFELKLFPAYVSLVVDYDDAVFHRYDQHRLSVVRTLLRRKIDAIMRRADLVVVGNEYLRERARQAGAKRVELLPTVVDANRYAVTPDAPGQLLTIGWIGSPSTVPYLYPKNS